MNTSPMDLRLWSNRVPGKNQNQLGDAADLAAADYYVWSCPGSVTIHLRLDVMERLVSQLEATPHGLLIGRIAGGITELVDFRVVPPTELLAAQAKAAFSEKAKGLQPMGYFRVERQGDLRLTAEDLDFMKAVFPNPNEVILLIRTGEFGARASFFFWNEDGKFSDVPALEFPFDSDRLSVTRISPQFPLELLEPPPQKSTFISWAASFAQAVRNKRVLLLGIICLASIALTIVGRSFLADGHSGSSAPALSTGLEIERRPRGDLKLTWNHAIPVMANATSGTVVVEDGGSQRVIVLDQSVLRTGSLLYSPQSEEVLITFNVQGPRETATDRVLVVSPKEANRK
jgi:hypothetical protein